MQKLASNPPIKAHPLGHLVYICAHLVTDSGHLVDERYLGSQERIRSVLDHFCCGHIGDNKRCFDKIEGIVKVFEDSDSLFALGADYDPVGTHEVLYGRSFPQELRIRSHIKRTGFCLVFLDDSLNHLPRAYRYCTLCHHHLIAVHGLTDGFGHLFHIFEVSASVLVRRGANSNKNHQSISNTLLDICGKGKSPLICILFYQLRKSWFVDRDFALIQHAGFGCIPAHTSNPKPKPGETGACHKPNVSYANYADIH